MKSAIRKAWGMFTKQTVGYTSQGNFYIREGDNRVVIKPSEVDSLVVSLLTVKEKAKHAK